MYTYICVLFQCFSGTSGLIVATLKWQKIVMRVRKKELGDWCKNRSKDREPKCSYYHVKSVARLMSTRERSSG